MRSSYRDAIHKIHGLLNYTVLYPLIFYLYFFSLTFQQHFLFTIFLALVMAFPIFPPQVATAEEWAVLAKRSRYTPCFTQQTLLSTETDIVRSKPNSSHILTIWLEMLFKLRDTQV